MGEGLQRSARSAAHKPPDRRGAAQCAHANAFKWPLSAAQSAARPSCGHVHVVSSGVELAAAVFVDRQRGPGDNSRTRDRDERLCVARASAATMSPHAEENRQHDPPVRRYAAFIAQTRRGLPVPPGSRRRQDPDACVSRRRWGAHHAVFGRLVPRMVATRASDSDEAARSTIKAARAASCGDRPSSRKRREIHGATDRRARPAEAAGAPASASCGGPPRAREDSSPGPRHDAIPLTAEPTRAAAHGGRIRSSCSRLRRRSARVPGGPAPRGRGPAQ